MAAASGAGPSRSMVTVSSPDVKRDRIETIGLDERAGENMLAGVLLHVVEASCPVDGALHRAATRHGTAHDVHDRLVFALLNVYNVGITDSPLSASCPPDSG